MRFLVLGNVLTRQNNNNNNYNNNLHVRRLFLSMEVYNVQPVISLALDPTDSRTGGWSGVWETSSVVPLLSSTIKKKKAAVSSSTRILFWPFGWG